MGYKSRQIGESTLKGPLMLAFKSRQIGESPPERPVNARLLKVDK
jgi:hypothetical protein